MDVMSRGKWVHGLTWMPASAPQFPHQLAVHDAEVQAELVPHLIPPLDLERGRADDQDAADPVPDDQFQSDHPGLDGLAQAHVVGDEQVDPWHLDGPDHRVKLVVLDLDAAAERGLEGFVVGRRDGTPAHRIQKGVQPGRIIEVGRLGQSDLLVDVRPRLQFPDDLQFLAQGVVLDRGERDDDAAGTEYPPGSSRRAKRTFERPRRRSAAAGL